ncbi:peptidylprolyl isomerase [Vampirovibrio sp.]|uniref:peptidylprolyl isomerase n=1 Tax=Vampirovibrio sp. TaxID=2717857 RepID=UPI003594716A
MNKTKVSLLAGMLAVTVLVSGCAKGGLGGGQKVATVNGTTITKAEYDKTYGDFEKSFHVENVPEAQKSVLDDYLKQMTLNKLILQTLINTEASKTGIKVTDAEVKEYKEAKIFNDPTLKEQFKTFLSQNKMQESDFDAMLRENLLLNKFMEAKGGQAVQVSDSEVKNFYDKNVDQFKVPESIHAKHILVKAIEPQIKQEVRKGNEKISDADLEKSVAAKKQDLKAKADKLFTEIKANPAQFEELAKKNSEDPMSAVKGGDLGYMPQGTVDPAFWAAADKTPKGQLYPGVVASQFGYHIIKVLDHKAPHQQTFAEAKDNIREQMSQQKKQAFLQQWAQQQRSVAKIDVEKAYQPKEPEAEAQGQGGVMPTPQGAAAPQPEAGKH